MAIVSVQSFVDSSCGGVVKRHIQCVQSPMHLVESAAPSGSSRLLSSMNFGSRNYKTALIDGQAYAWLLSVFTPKQVFCPRTAKSQPLWIKYCTHLLLYGIHLWPT